MRELRLAQKHALHDTSINYEQPDVVGNKYQPNHVLHDTSIFMVLRSIRV